MILFELLVGPCQAQWPLGRIDFPRKQRIHFSAVQSFFQNLLFGRAPKTGRALQSHGPELCCRLPAARFPASAMARMMSRRCAAAASENATPSSGGFARETRAKTRWDFGFTRCGRLRLGKTAFGHADDTRSYDAASPEEWEAAMRGRACNWRHDLNHFIFQQRGNRGQGSTCRRRCTLFGVVGELARWAGRKKERIASMDKTISSSRKGFEAA